MRWRIVATSALLGPACFDPSDSTSTATVGATEASSTGSAETAGPSTDDGPSTGDGASNDAVTDSPTTSAGSDPDSSGTETTGNPVRCTAPALLGTLPTLSQTLGTAVWGSRGYVTEANSGLLVLDLTDPTNPAQLGQIGTSNPTTVVVEGTTAYVGSVNGLFVIDASNGAALVQVGAVMDPSILTVTGVAIDGGYVYLTDNDNADPCSTCGLHVVDTSNFAVVASLPIADDVREVVIAGSYAFVAISFEGLAVIDVSTPTAPALVTTVALPAFTFKLAIEGDRLYAALGDGGLGVLDISDPPNPVVLGNAPGSFVSGVAVDGNWVWVTDMTGLRVLDVSDPASIVEIGALEGFDEQGAGIALGSTFALVGSYEDGARTVAPPVCD